LHNLAAGILEKPLDFGLLKREFLEGYPLGEQAGLGARWRRVSDEGLQTASQRLRHFGFNFDYVPIEELQRARQKFGTP